MLTFVPVAKTFFPFFFFIPHFANTIQRLTGARVGYSRIILTFIYKENSHTCCTEYKKKEKSKTI